MVTYTCYENHPKLIYLHQVVLSNKGLALAVDDLWGSLDIPRWFSDIYCSQVEAMGLPFFSYMFVLNVRYMEDMGVLCYGDLWGRVSQNMNGGLNMDKHPFSESCEQQARMIHSHVSPWFLVLYLWYGRCAFDTTMWIYHKSYGSWQGWSGEWWWIGVESLKNISDDSILDVLGGLSIYIQSILRTLWFFSSQPWKITDFSMEIITFIYSHHLYT